MPWFSGWMQGSRSETAKRGLALPGPGGSAASLGCPSDEDGEDNLLPGGVADPPAACVAADPGGTGPGGAPFVVTEVSEVCDGLSTWLAACIPAGVGSV